MKLKYKNVWRNIFIRVIIGVLLLLLAFGLITYHIYLQHEGFFTLSYPHDEKITTNPLDEELHTGDIFKGEIKAEENYFGIIGFKFDTFDRINHDVLIFRLREKGKNSWYYERNYQSKLLFGNTYYTIGFPKITDSKKKTYEFEFVSTKGTYGDAIAIEDVHPLVIARYEIPKSVVFSSKDHIIDFVRKKLLLQIRNNSSLLFAFIIYFFPLFFYLSWLLYFEKRFKREQEQLKNAVGFHFFFLIYSKYALLYLMLIALFIDIILMQETYDLVILVIFTLWILVNYVYKAGSNLSFVIAIAFVALCGLFAAFTIDTIATKFALWTYVFLWYGIILLIWESIYKPKKQLRLLAVYEDLRSDSREIVHLVQKQFKKRRKVL